MRLGAAIFALAFFALPGPASAQAWDVYTNRENFFTVNFPGQPTVTEAPYPTANGTPLTARVFTATAPADTVLAGTYTVTVVDYTNAKDEISTAVEHAANAIKAKGTVKYEGLNNLDLHLSNRLTVETAMTRILAEIVVAENNRLYITEAATPLTLPPAGIFQASLQILDANGARIRERVALGVPPGVVSPIGAGGVPDESNSVAQTVAGSWRASGGRCEAAFFKSGDRSKSKRGEEGLNGTITNAGMTISGLLVLNGARAGQFVDPTSDKAILLFDPQNGDKLSISGVGAPALDWPEMTLELCPGSRG